MRRSIAVATLSLAFSVGARPGNQGGMLSSGQPCNRILAIQFLAFE